MISSSTSVIGLIGNPVRHSLSPWIHNFFIEKYSLDAVYLAFEFRKENLKEAFNGVKKLGFKGLNVTMPYKKEVFKLVDKNDEVAAATGSVNTVNFNKKNLIAEGFNTDTGGFIKSLDKKKFKWAKSSCLVIGAGGAAGSAVYGLILKKVKKIFIYNRTIEKAIALKEGFKTFRKGGIEALEDINNIDNMIGSIDLIVNCTPVGMHIKSYKNIMPVPEKWNLKNKFIFDMVYNPVETLFLKKAKKDEAELINGIDLLVNQAALSFKIWFGIMPGEINIEEIKHSIM